ncbi:hypothetical protein CHS0354_018688 [Potamilus streckersoni]|uniref:Uncharacterized protein n=1 Tax=Potamilus streckersoni TaxID=2493646 RepID=A0AAE0SKL1_9BIVA|nr:hypothetical protein CHS0354_018688 [Potamilus streckersoni]
MGNQLLAFENDLIIMTRVRKALKRWKFLQLEISKKQETVNKGGRSNRLEPYKKERDELVEQMKKDIPELQSVTNL